MEPSRHQSTENSPIVVRAAREEEIDQLTTVWYDAWQDAHAALLPEDFKRLRTWESFRQRLRDALPNVRVVGPPGAPVGFHLTKDAELYQLFVASGARGSGVAAALIADAEARLAAQGVETAWLACAIGNTRASRFYEKQGWKNIGSVPHRVETPSGEYQFEVWRFEKKVG